MEFSWFGNTQTEIISRQIADASSQGKQQRDFIETMITEFKNSDTYKFMGVAQRYYENNSDIEDKRRTVIAKDLENNAVLKESRILANNRLHHNFMKKLTRQKLGYMLSKPFTLTQVHADDEEAKKFFQAMEPILI